MSKPFDRSEFAEGYLSEADDHLRLAEANLLRLEQALLRGEGQPRVIRELFRSLHTLKGLSAMVGVEPIVEIAHEMEALLRTTDQNNLVLSKEAIELSLKAVHAIEQRVRAFAKQRPVPAAPAKLIEALRGLLVAPAPALLSGKASLTLEPALLSKLATTERDQLVEGIVGGRRALRLDFSPSPEKAARELTITSVRERVGAIAEIVKVLPHAVEKSATAPGGLTFVLLVLTSAADESVREAAATDALMPITLKAAEEDAFALNDAYLDEETSDQEQAQRSTIRIDVARLDEALDKVSAVVVTRFRLARAVADLRQRGVDVRDLQNVLLEHSRELRDLRASITRARMVSVAQLLERVPLLVRAMSRASNREVRVEIDAGRAELDKTVAERVFPALLHLIRNAVDHAIEPPELRKQLGKPEEGRIIVRCFERSDSQLELTVSDDGSGIDAQKVARKVGRPLPEDDRALLELIALPGLSTRDTATERSGRGMGMDIVRRVAVDMLGGELILQTKPDVGTTFTLRIPLSISILDSFAFTCGSEAYVVPLAMVEEIVELDAASIFSAPHPCKKRSSETKMLRRRDETIPLFDLRSLFSGTQLGDDPARDGRAQVSQTALPSALVVQRNGQRFAFAVDRMLGQQEIVIRPLNDRLVKVSGVSGTTDLGDGRPTLVLDLARLSETASRLSPMHGELPV
jgi:two-component system chemotaxis sensor kinase CheA